MKIKAIIYLMMVILLMSPNLEAQNWMELFNGKDLDNWTILNGTADFEIEGDIIVGISKMNTPNTFLATKKTYSNFILEYEVYLDDGLNSGVQIRSLSSPDYQDERVHGYQVELDPSSRAWTGGIYDEARRGWLYHLEYNPPARKAYKNEEWNKFRIEAIGNQIRVWLNGIQTADLIDDLTEEGFIALQVHGIGEKKELVGKKVRFRNIRILTEGLEKEKSPGNAKIAQVSYLTNQLSEREKKEKWQLLWDGKTTEGWRSAKSDNFPEKGWKIEDGILSVEKSGGAESAHGGDIVTVKKYKNFVLELDFKFTKGANSGIKYFVDPNLNTGKGSAIGCEYQILDDEIHPDGKKGTAGNRTLASLYDLIPANAQFYAPHERPKRLNKYNWNRARIVVSGNKVEHFLNGIKVIEYERRTQTWRALVARSKYHVWPKFGEAEEGHLLLQDHGDQVFYKNIKINEED